MTILVTGATGQVGRRIVPHLLTAGESVRVLVRDPAVPVAVDQAERGAEVVTGDLRDPDAVKRAVDGTTAVVNVAATFRDHSLTPEDMAAVNTDAALTLARAALAAGVTRHVFISTNLVYGRGHALPVDEDAEARADGWGSAYPVTKVAAERGLLDLHAEQGLDLRILRLAFVYGAGDPHLAQAPQFFQDAHPGLRLQMVHHVDVCQAVLRALRTDGVGGRIYNVADDAPVTAAEVFWLNGLTPKSPEGRSLDDPFFGLVRTDRIRRELGFRPVFPTVYTARDAGAL